MCSILLAAWLGYAVPLLAFIMLLVLGFMLGRWLFKKVLPRFFDEGQRNWKEPDK